MILRGVATVVAALFFLVALYVAYVAYRLSTPWPPDGETLNLALPIFLAVVVVAASLGALFLRIGRPWR